MDALRRRQQGLCKAVCEGGDNAVQIGTALNAVGHAGLFKCRPIPQNAGERETAEALALWAFCILWNGMEQAGIVVNGGKNGEIIGGVLLHIAGPSWPNCQRNFCRPC